MRTALAYTSARVLLLVVSLVLLYLIGARGFLLIALACLVSGIASFVLLSRQRDLMSGALMARIKTGHRRASGFRARLEEGAQAEDDDLQPPDGGAEPDHRRRRPRRRCSVRLVRRTRQPPSRDQELQHGADGLITRHGRGIEHQVGVARFLVGIGYSGEAFDQARLGLGV
jgi:hypothetical protein